MKTMEERLLEQLQEQSQENEMLKQEKKILSVQVQAASDRQDFLEDCIAEMAILVYDA